MTLHALTPDEVSRFDNAFVALQTKVQLVAIAMRNFKDKSGNDTVVGDAMKAVKDQIDTIATITGIAVSS